MTIGKILKQAKAAIKEKGPEIPEYFKMRIVFKDGFNIYMPPNGFTPVEMEQLVNEHGEEVERCWDLPNQTVRIGKMPPDIEIDPVSVVDLPDEIH